MKGKSNDESQINSKASSDVMVNGDVVGENKTPPVKNDLEMGYEIAGGGVTITATSISINGDVVGGSKTVIVKSKDTHSVNCQNCGRSYLPAENKFACPNCGIATPKYLLNQSIPGGNHD